MPQARTNSYRVLGIIAGKGMASAVPLARTNSYQVLGIIAGKGMASAMPLARTNSYRVLGIIAAQCDPGLHEDDREPPPGGNFIGRRSGMKKLTILALAGFAALLLAPAAFAQDQAAATGGGVDWVVLTAGFAMAMAASICAIGQSRVASAACEGMARNPGAAGAIRTAMILGLVLIETLALFTLLVVFVKL
jgi:F-type H+-transporting ATPase subunit c